MRQNKPDPDIYIGDIFEKACLMADIVVPPQREPFAEAFSVMNRFLVQAQEDGVIDEVYSVSPGATLDYAQRERFTLKAPLFDERMANRQVKPSSDFQIELGLNRAGKIVVELGCFAENMGVLYKYTRTTHKPAIVNKPFECDSLQDRPAQAYLKLTAEYLIYASRLLSDRGARKSSPPSPDFQTLSL
jgi:hypothetical protein